MFSLVDFVALVARFLSSNKITTKISELKRKRTENAKNFVRYYCSDYLVYISILLRIVYGSFPYCFPTSLADAEAGEDGGEDVGGGEGAGDGGEVVEGGAEVLGDEVAGEVGA